MSDHACDRGAARLDPGASRLQAYQPDEDGQGSRSRQEDPRLGHHLQATPGHHRRLGVDQTMAALGVTPGHSSPATPAWSCLTRAGHRPVAWPHEIPDSGISHRNTGSSPCSGTEAGDSSPVFAALEHAAGDFTALGTDHSLECSSPPSDTQSGGTSPFSEHRLNTRTARLTPAASPRR